MKITVLDAMEAVSVDEGFHHWHLSEMHSTR